MNAAWQIFFLLAPLFVGKNQQILRATRDLGEVEKRKPTTDPDLPSGKMTDWKISSTIYP